MCAERRLRTPRDGRTDGQGPRRWARARRGGRRRGLGRGLRHLPVFLPSAPAHFPRFRFPRAPAPGSPAPGGESRFLPASPALSPLRPRPACVPPPRSPRLSRPFRRSLLRPRARRQTRCRPVCERSLQGLPALCGRKGRRRGAGLGERLAGPGRAGITAPLSPGTGRPAPGPLAASGRPRLWEPGERPPPSPAAPDSGCEAAVLVPAPAGLWAGPRAWLSGFP